VSQQKSTIALTVLPERHLPILCDAGYNDETGLLTREAIYGPPTQKDDISPGRENSPPVATGGSGGASY